VSLYIEGINEIIDEHQMLILILSFTMFSIIVAFFIFIAAPLFWRINRLRKTYWTELYTLIKSNGMVIKARCTARLVDVHCTDIEDLKRTEMAKS
jgi:hypothetical protein